MAMCGLWLRSYVLLLVHKIEIIGDDMRMMGKFLGSAGRNNW